MQSPFPIPNPGSAACNKINGNTKRVLGTKQLAKLLQRSRCARDRQKKIQTVTKNPSPANLSPNPTGE
jgi:hypothetical protein